MCDDADAVGSAATAVDDDMMMNDNTNSSSNINNTGNIHGNDSNTHNLAVTIPRPAP